MMVSEHPPHLACIGAYDGHHDPYRGWSYTGGIYSSFTTHWWNNSVRIANLFPANGGTPRDVEIDLTSEILKHPNIDDFWLERDIYDELKKVRIPVYSIGTWAKRELHLSGNLKAYQLVSGPKKLKLLDLASGAVALQLFETIAFHNEVLLPFYDHYLKGLHTDYVQRPNVEYALVGTTEMRAAETWPPLDVSYTPVYLNADVSRSVRSVNDGGLGMEVGQAAAVSFDYPGPNWLFGPVVMGPAGPDTVQEVLTFTTPVLAQDADVVGPIELIVHLSSSRCDTNVVARLLEQEPCDEADRLAGKQPPSKVVSKGWLRAAHRAIDESESIEGDPRHLHDREEPLVPGEATEMRVALVGCGHRFKRGSRIRLEISCADTQFTDMQFAHAFLPTMVGTDTVHLGCGRPSRLLLPVANGTKLRFEAGRIGGSHLPLRMPGLASDFDSVTLRSLFSSSASGPAPIAENPQFSFGRRRDEA